MLPLFSMHHCVKLIDGRATKLPPPLIWSEVGNKDADKHQNKLWL